MSRTLNEIIEKIFKNCLEEENQNKKVVLSEKKVEFKAKNQRRKKYIVFKPDKCIKNKKSCDYLIVIIDDKGNIEKIFLVELKGSHIEDAIKQIEACLEEIKSKIGKYTLKEIQIAARIITNRGVPNITATKEKELKKLLKELNKDNDFSKYKTCNKWEEI